MKKENLFVILTGVVIGIAALVLTALGNPANMGFCIACFERDIAGAVGLHSAAKVQYVRPEIIGLVLGSFLMALASKEWKARAGSSPALRFVLGAFVMIGALAFLGCPLRMVLRLAGGDLNAVVGLAGFAAGIFLGTIFIRKGFTLQRNYATKTLDGTVLPAVMVGLLILFLAVPTLFKLSEEGPGSKHAPFLIALLIALVVGALAQKSRICMVGGLRDTMMFKDLHLLWGFIAIFVTVLIGNLCLHKFNLGFAGQPVAHSDHVWNFLGMLLAGWGSVLLGGCPLRQLILAGSGNADSAVTVFGMIVGAAFAALAGVIVGVPVLRLKGDYLAIVTLAFGEIIKNIVNVMYLGRDADGLHFSLVEQNFQLGDGGKMIINGPIGVSGVAKISTFTSGVVLILVTLFFVLNFINSRTGRAVMAVRDNKIAADSIGISVTHYKLLAFVVSAAFAGMAGTLYAMNFSTVTAAKFDFNTSILVLVFVVLGGLGNIWGSIIAAALLTLLPELLRGLSNYRMLIYAILLIAMMLFNNSSLKKRMLEKRGMKQMEKLERAEKSGKEGA